MYLLQVGLVGALVSSVSLSTPQPCPVCNRVYEDSERLRVHLRYHERYLRGANVCHVCGRRAQSQSHLKVHMRTHTGERPHACPSCPYRASDPSNLKKHIRALHEKYEQSFQ